MKTNLWAVIAVVSGLVGFLTGYSLSGYTGMRNLEQARAPQAAEGGAHAGTAATAGLVVDAAERTAVAKPAAGGYGQKPAAAPAPAAGGYGAAPSAPQRPAAPAAGYGR